MWEQKQFRNNWGVEKRNPSVEADPFLERVDRKPIALAKTFLTIENERKPKSFSARGFFQIFDENPVLEIIKSFYIQEVFPSTFLDESSIEFEFPTDRNLYLDMRDTQLILNLQLFKGRLLDAFEKEKEEYRAKSEDDSDEEPKTYLTYLKNLLYSLFSIMKFVLTIQWLTTPMGCILIRHIYWTNSTSRQRESKEHLLFTDIFLKKIRKHLIWIPSLIE